MVRDLSIGQKFAVFVIIIGIIIGYFIFWIMPSMSQEQMYDYHGEEIFPDVVLYYHVACPFDGHTDELVYLNSVENKVVYSQVEGIRKDITDMWYCNIHTKVFYLR
jgi:hypothetical protein